MGLADKSDAQKTVPWFSAVQLGWDAIITLLISNEFVDLDVPGKTKLLSLGHGSNSAAESSVATVKGPQLELTQQHAKVHLHYLEAPCRIKPVNK